MRHLHLARYGKFTDRALEFSKHQDGRPDLHVVFGPNEAGKSTTLAGYLDLLFGIEAESRYAFLHPARRSPILFGDVTWPWLRWS